MDKTTFKGLCEKFTECKNPTDKVELLLTYDLKTLSNSQIDRLLLPLSEEETKYLIRAISKKINN